MEKIDSGSTDGEVELSRDPRTGVFVVDFVAQQGNPENRWTLEFSKAVHVAYDAIEREMEADPKGTPAAVLTVSSSPKFFSNGIDPDWARSPLTAKNDLDEWNDLVMPAFARPLLLPCPTLCAINGHAFGAGLMYALGTDYRLQKLERGYLCAIEVAIGVNTPPPELTLFRHSLPASSFYETILFAKRWGGAEALARGLVQAAVPGDALRETAMQTAAQLAQLAKNRTTYAYTKRELKSYVAREILEFSFKAGARKGAAPLPVGLQRHVDALVGSERSTWGQRHVGASNEEALKMAISASRSML